MKEEKVVINDLVGFKSLKIYQNKDYFNFSLDSVLLPNFVHFNKNVKNILDLCTGNAPIPLILSRKTNAKIIGVEIQKEIYDLAIKSVEINNLSNQISIINKDVKEIYNDFESDYFDIITCNPPYFKINEKSLRNENDVKTIARHEVLINLEDISKVAKKLLKNNGSLYLVHKADRLTDIINVLRMNNLEPKRLQIVYPKNGEIANIVLIEAKKNGKSGLIIEKPIIAHESDGQYTKEVLKMFE